MRAMLIQIIVLLSKMRQPVAAMHIAKANLAYMPEQVWHYKELALAELRRNGAPSWLINSVIYHYAKAVNAE